MLWPSDVNWLIGKDLDARKDWRQEKGMKEDEMVGWHHQCHGHEFEQAGGVGDGQESLACCSPWGCRVEHNWASELTEWLFCVIGLLFYPGMDVSWTIKNDEWVRTDAFESRCWRRLLRVPWTARRSNQPILKEINPEYSLEGLMLKLKLQYLGHLMQRTDSLEKTLARLSYWTTTTFYPRIKIVLYWIQHIIMSHNIFKKMY